MGWRNVVITQHSKLSYSANNMVVQNKKGITQIPISDINLLIIDTTQAVITSYLMSELAKNNSKVIFTDDKYMPITETVNYSSSNSSYKLLKAQFEWDQDLIENLWTKVVASKISNQVQVLKKLDLDFEDVEAELNKLEKNDVTNREAVAARAYFNILFGEKFRRSDEGDAINSALNYGYAILLSSLSRAIVQYGCLNQVGIHHRSVNNPYNLACDLMEPFRPFVDYWVASQKKLLNFTPDIKYGLIMLLNYPILYNGKKELLCNAISKYTISCLDYMFQKSDKYEGVMEIVDEVQDNASYDNV